MPYKPKKPCAYPGCPELTSSKYCERHRALEEKHHPSPRNPFYQSKEWRTLRREYIESHPCCVSCGRRAEIVDHIVPIKNGGAALDERNLQSLCWSCHSRKSIVEGSRYKRKEHTY